MLDEPISVVIPVYNSAATLPALLDRLSAVLRQRGTEYEIILINDGSRDQSWETIARLAHDRPQVVGIDLSRNYGQHNALICGIRAAQYPVIVTMDDDLQHPPEAIPQLLDRLAEGHDVVYGTPLDERHGWWRDTASVLTKLALRHVMGAATARQVSAFRAFHTSLRDAFAEYRSPFVCLDVLLSWGTTRFTAIGVPHQQRQVGRSNYNLRKLSVHALNLITGFSTLPLQVASLVGFVTLLFGLVVLAYVVGRYALEGTSMPGFPFLASIVTIFSGSQLFAIGIIGEYLARMHFRILDRPAYVVRRQFAARSSSEKQCCA